MEDLAYDTVVEVNGGTYDCLLLGGVTDQKVPLSAVDGESYVAMRVGEEGNFDFPEEVVAFPQSGAPRNCVLGALFLSLLLNLLLRNGGSM